jgi:hypothetical protein
MMRARFTAGLSMGLVLLVLLACKKKPDTDAAASASAATPAPSSAAPAPTPTPAPTPAAAAPKLGDVKRYGVDKEEKLDGAGVRVSADELKVFNEADTKTPEVATLPKGLLVFRLVKMESFTLVEFPSGVGQFSEGWVETTALSDQAEKVSREGALSEKKTATVKVGDAGAPAPKASATAAPKASATAAPKPSATTATTASATAAPKATASAAPKASATAAPKATTTGKPLKAKPKPTT